MTGSVLKGMDVAKANLLSNLGVAVAGALRRKRTGPFHRERRDLMVTLTRLRDSVRSETSPQIRSFLAYCLPRLASSYAQLGQDLFVDYALGGKRNGFFCEFGATDGIALSNSRYLEEALGWTGICAEPARAWHDALRRNRPRTIIDTDCVWSETGRMLEFRQTSSLELSTIAQYTSGDGYSAKRSAGGETYQVRTVSLGDLLARHGAPAVFDYLSIDTEGSELAILQAADFTRHRPRVVTVEHNFTPNRDALHALLTSRGYFRVLTECSLSDDWYVETDLAERFAPA